MYCPDKKLSESLNKVQAGIATEHLVEVLYNGGAVLRLKLVADSVDRDSFYLVHLSIVSTLVSTSSLKPRPSDSQVNDHHFLLGGKLDNDDDAFLFLLGRNPLDLIAAINCQTHTTIH